MSYFIIKLVLFFILPSEKILIVRFSSIGDIVLTTPVIRTLKSQLGVCRT